MKTELFRLFRKMIIRFFAFVVGLSSEYKAVIEGDLFPQSTNPMDLIYLYRFALQNIAYYKTSLPKVYKFEDAPIIEKTNLKENIFQFIDPHLHTAIDYKDCFIKSLLKLLRGSCLIPINTGGSSGSPLSFYRSRQTGLRIILGLLAIARFHGWKEGEPLMSIWQEGMYAQVGFFAALLRFLGFPLFLFKNMDEASLALFLKYFERLKPTAIITFPSYLSELATLMKKRNMLPKVKVRFILCGGETLFDHQRKLIEETFQCKVYNEYASNELGYMAVECKEQNGLHVLEQDYFVENLNEHIVVTPLKMYDMPLIKYDTGDRGNIAFSKCPCGIFGKKINNLEGRVEEYLLDGLGSKVYVSYLRQLICAINIDSNIVRAQFIQKRDGKLYFRVEFTNKNKKTFTIIKYLEQKLRQDLNIEVFGSTVDTLFQKKGKFKFLIREE